MIMNVKLFSVAPSIPEELGFLEKLSNNLWWSWHPLAVELFVRIDPVLWRDVHGNARKFMNLVSQERLEELAGDEVYLRQLKLVQTEFEKTVSEKEDFSSRRYAYFSLEYGLHESVRIYSGGLGVLAGDHLKAASDMKLPLVAVGLLYRQGYFRQVLDRNGWQMERYPENEINNLPLKRARGKNGEELVISIKLCDRELFAAVWVLNVGNVPLVMLDAEIPQNPPDLRETTWRLYGGDKRMRLHQELLLGVGGFKALIAMGYDPAVCHMNEGHAGFLSLARIDHLVKQGYSPDVALEVVWRSNVFTTHTPVPAGNEVFDINLVRPYLDVIAREAGLDVDRVIRWGIPIGERDRASEISMTVFGLRMANYSNGVSRLHGEVARSMWKHLWPGRSISEIPIKHITNGVHIPSWISQRLSLLFNRYLAANWMFNPDIEKLAEDIKDIPNEDLWMCHELNRQSLIRKAKKILQDKNKVVSQCGEANKSGLSPDVLTIGFARRFATYKRGTLLLRNEDRLIRLLRDTERPVQFIYAGKAHPADNGGKELIQKLIQFAQRAGVQHRLVFLEDYDIAMARSLVKGVDIWLNTPRRPQEASGTSGMKAAINGVLNCSILDGWWAEAASPEVGWAIEGNDNYTDPEDTDNFESQALFDILEHEIIPCFYDRGEGDLPQRWVEKMKNSIVMGLGKFSSTRMVEEYVEMFYKPAYRDYQKLVADDGKLARELESQKRKYIENFGKLYIAFPDVEGNFNSAHVGDKYKISTRVYLAGLRPEEVKVECYYGTVDIHNEIRDVNVSEMKMIEDKGDSNYLYECTISCNAPGRYGLTARITPAGSDWNNSVPGFICWPQ